MAICLRKGLNSGSETEDLCLQRGNRTGYTFIHAGTVADIHRSLSKRKGRKGFMVTSFSGGDGRDQNSLSDGQIEAKRYRELLPSSFHQASHEEER
jgi:hypothetical protein